MKSHTILVLAAMVISSAYAIAHDDAGPHGGRLADASKHHLELVIRNDLVEVFVSDKANQPVPATGLTGLAILVASATSTRIALTGEGDKLSGKAATRLPHNAKSVVQVKLPDGQTIQASFD